MRLSVKARLERVERIDDAASRAQDGLWGPDGQLQLNPFVVGIQSGAVVVYRMPGEPLAVLAARASKRHPGRQWAEVFDPDPCVQNFIREMSAP